MTKPIYLLPAVPATLALAAAPALAGDAAPESKTVIARLSDLPTYTYPMPARTSVMVRDAAAVRAR